MCFYINYVFSKIEYDDTIFIGVLETGGEKDNVFCRFSYNRKTNQTTIWDMSYSSTASLLSHS